MLLNEVLDNPLKWERTQSGGTSYIADFDIGDINYELEAHETDGGIDDPDYYTIEFTANIGNKATQEITKTGNSLQVFATITAMIKEFIKLNNPAAILFTAKEPSRAKLYDRLAKLFVSAGFNLDMDDSGNNSKQYWLEKR